MPLTTEGNPMRLAFAVAALLLTAMPAAAAPPHAPGDIPSARVLSAVTGDWNNDGSIDHAVLFETDDSYAGLAIFLSKGNGGVALSAFNPHMAFNGQMAGSTPELRVAKSGSLQLHSENMAVGRDHWERTLTISYRGNRVVVSGITASDYDTLDPNSGTSCDINLLTGKGKAGKKTVKVKAGGVPLAKWDDDTSTPKACQ
jgi:hypothetical protein